MSGASPERSSDMATICWAADDQLRELIYREYWIMYPVDDTNEEVLILTVIHSSRQFGE